MSCPKAMPVTAGSILLMSTPFIPDEEQTAGESVKCQKTLGSA